MAIEIATAGIHLELETLARRYALAMDRRDRAALLSIFETDASMRVEQPGREPVTLRGHAELARLTEAIARWPRTMHYVAHGLYHVDSEDARGEIYCCAHHFDSVQAGTGRDHVMHIVYADSYRLGADRNWSITHRVVTVEAIEDHPVRIS